MQLAQLLMRPCINENELVLLVKYVVKCNDTVMISFFLDDLIPRQLDTYLSTVRVWSCG